jgi:hypothetical protein
MVIGKSESETLTNHHGTAAIHVLVKVQDKDSRCREMDETGREASSDKILVAAISGITWQRQRSYVDVRFAHTSLRTDSHSNAKDIINRRNSETTGGESRYEKNTEPVSSSQIMVDNHQTQKANRLWLQLRYII